MVDPPASPKPSAAVSEPAEVSGGGDTLSAAAVVAAAGAGSGAPVTGKRKSGSSSRDEQVGDSCSRLKGIGSRIGACRILLHDSEAILVAEYDCATVQLRHY